MPDGAFVFEFEVFDLSVQLIFAFFSIELCLFLIETDLDLLLGVDFPKTHTFEQYLEVFRILGR